MDFSESPGISGIHVQFLIILVRSDAVYGRDSTGMEITGIIRNIHNLHEPFRTQH